MLKSAALRSACSVFGVIRAGGIYGHSCNVRTFGIVVLSGELMGNVTVCLIFLFDLVKKLFIFSFEFRFCRSVTGVLGLHKP